MKSTILTDEQILRDLAKQANRYGCKLRVRRYKSSKYLFTVTGTTSASIFPLKMRGSAKWLSRQLVKMLLLMAAIEKLNKNQKENKIKENENESENRE